MRILGVDPGYAIVGFGVLEYTGTTFTPITYGAITTAAETPFLRRLESIYRDFRTLIQQYHPDCVAMERLYFTSNQKTVIDVAQARGVLMLTAQLEQIPVSEYTPLQVKQAVVGYGREEASHGIDTPDFKAAKNPEAGRCCRCTGNCHLPRTLCNGLAGKNGIIGT